jgi:hypothetical protein
MKLSYQIVARKDSQGCARYWANNGQLLLPLGGLVEASSMAAGELTDLLERAGIEAMLRVWAVGVAGKKHQGRQDYRRTTALLRRDGWLVNHKRVERIWRQEYNTMRPHRALGYHPPAPETRVVIPRGPGFAQLRQDPWAGMVTTLTENLV